MWGEKKGRKVEITRIHPCSDEVLTDGRVEGEAIFIYHCVVHTVSDLHSSVCDFL